MTIVVPVADPGRTQKLQLEAQAINDSDDLNDAAVQTLGNDLTSLRLPCKILQH